MTIQDPNLLNPFTLLDPSIASPFSLLITIASICFCAIISFYFFKSYRFSGFGYLLGLPIGFTILGMSLVFEHLSLIYYVDSLLYHVFFWLQVALQSEALALIGLSYALKNRLDSSSRNESASYLADLDISKLVLRHGLSTKARDVLFSVLPMIMISVPLMVPISALFVQPFLNYTELADLSFYMRIFDIIILGYIFKAAIVSLIRGANVRLLYVPAAFALLWLEQYSLIIMYFDNSSSAFIVATIARLTGLSGLALFVYALHYAMHSKSQRVIKIETREKT